MYRRLRRGGKLPGMHVGTGSAIATGMQTTEKNEVALMTFSLLARPQTAYTVAGLFVCAKLANGALNEVQRSVLLAQARTLHTMVTK